MIVKRTTSAISATAMFAAAAAILLACFSAGAGSPQTTTFHVSLTVVNDCTISATDLTFPSATSALVTTPIFASSTISVTCTTGDPYSVSLDKGTGAGTTVGLRTLNGTGSNVSTVQYLLCHDSGCSSIWGDATGGTTPATGTGNGGGTTGTVPQTITVYGEVPAQTIPPADTYTSLETATITF
jgi:spore coat protein U-like protein